jgi:membrane-bound lytic murein transglycosylase F
MSKKLLTEQFFLFFLFLAQLFFVMILIYHKLYYWPGDSLRVLWIDLENDGRFVNRPFFSLSPYGPGLEMEMVDIFCRQNNLKPIWIKVSNLHEGLKKLRSGFADLLIGLTTVDEVKKDGVKFGPGYLKNNFIIVHNRFRYPLRRPDELCNALIFVPDTEIFRHKLNKYQNKILCSIKYKLFYGSIYDMYQALSENKARFALTDKITFQLLHPFFPDILQTYSFKDYFQYRWSWTTRYRELNDKLTRFWNHFAESKKYLYLKEKYYGFFPSKIDYYELRHLLKIVEWVLPEYDEYILEAAKKYKIDPLFLVAMIYQESHFNPMARSKTGVRGLLQLSLDTASYVGISDRVDPEQSILGGARYLRFLVNKIKKKGVDGWDRWFFALAAYNQGPGHLYDAMDLARRLKKDHLRWMELKDVYPLLSYRRYYRTAKRGYCRGFEALDYVESIRYYYYILHGLVVLARPEAKHLTRFLDFIPSGWPD